MTPTTAPARRANYRAHGRPTRGHYFGHGRQPAGNGQPVTIHPVIRPTTCRVQVRDAVTGETIVELVTGARFWLAPAAA